MIAPLHSYTETLDDLPLLLAILQQMQIRPQLDAHLRPHGNWEGISPGTVIVIWLAYLLTTGDHRLVSVREWAAEHTTLLNTALALHLRPTDLSDDRLALVLTQLGDPATQQVLDAALWHHWLRVYPLPQHTVRLDSSTVCVYHHPTSDTSLLRFGFHREGKERLRQFKVMLSTLDPLGMPLASSLEAGNCADDGLYLPSYERAVTLLGSREVLVVGDSKMSSLATRAQLVQRGSHYLCPLNEVSLLNADREAWIHSALLSPERWQTIYAPRSTSTEAIAVALEFQREQAWTAPDGKPVQWQERIVLARSAQQQQHLIAQGERRWQHVQTQLTKLSQTGRGRRVYRQRKALQQVIDHLLRAAGLEEVVEVELGEQALSRGQTRWVVTRFERDRYAWQRLCDGLGWRVYATDRTVAQLATDAVVWTYRQQVLHERTFARLKTRDLHLQPVFLRDEQRLSGLIWLLTLALQVLTLTEFRLRHALQQQGAGLTGLNPAVPSQTTAQPTVERVLGAFRALYFTEVQLAEQRLRTVTPLTALQEQILGLLGIAVTIYTGLAQPP